MPDPRTTYFGQLIVSIGALIKLALPLVLGLALLYFFWGVFQFILKAESDKERAEGKKKITFGIVALFVIISTWGLVATLGQIFRVDTHSYGESGYTGGCDGTDENPC